jgi:hypothetical protein
MVVFCSSANVPVVVMSVIVLVKFHPHSIQAVQVMEDVERKVMLPRRRMLVFVHVVGQRRVEGYLLQRDGGIFVLEKFCPRSIYGWAWFAKVKWKVGIHLSIHCTACFVIEEEVVEFNCGVFR